MIEKQKKEQYKLAMIEASKDELYINDMKSIENELSGKLNKNIISLISKELEDKVKIIESNKSGKKIYKASVPTGYYIITERGYIDEVMRRRSPIRFTVIPVDGYYYVVVFVFKTSDWRKVSIKLLHIGAVWKRYNKKIINVREFLVKLIELKLEDINNIVDEILHNIRNLVEKDYCL